MTPLYRLAKSPTISTNCASMPPHHLHQLLLLLKLLLLNKPVNDAYQHEPKNQHDRCSNNLEAVKKSA
jgi:hypothetical protein